MSDLIAIDARGWVGEICWRKLWSSFCDWAEKHGSHLAKLADEGRVFDIEGLAFQLAHTEPPEDTLLRPIFENLVEAADLADGFISIVEDGMYDTEEVPTSESRSETVRSLLAELRERGGSKPGHSFRGNQHRKVPRQTQPEHEDVSRAWMQELSPAARARIKKELGVTVDQVHEMYTHDLGSGLHTFISEASFEDGQLELVGAIMLGNEEVTSFNRILSMGEHGLEAEHDQILVAEKHQGHGIGWRFTRATEDVYLRHGVKKITMFADAEVGAYAWARMGFDFSDKDDRKLLTSRLRSHWRKVVGSEIPEDTLKLAMSHSYNLARLRAPFVFSPKFGNRIGKQFLTVGGRSFSAFKMVDPKHHTWRAGRIYYEEKEKEANAGREE